MTESAPHSDDSQRDADQADLKAMLSGKPSGIMVAGRRIFGRLPSDPRCKMCATPFSGPFAPILRRMGRGPWSRNPKYCEICFRDLVKKPGGAEVVCSLLFADVRQSTTMAEGMRPTEFRAQMDRFFQVASRVLIEHDAIVDKFVGDEVIGIFVPLLAGERHAERAVSAGRALLKATGNDTDAPWLPVGGGVNTGVAYIGTVGEGDLTELTALGDPVNVAARLASAAAAGELLVTTAALTSAGLPDTGLEHRSLTLKGRSDATEVVVLHAGR